MDVNSNPSDYFRWVMKTRFIWFDNGCHLYFEDGDLWGIDPEKDTSFHADLDELGCADAAHERLVGWLSYWDAARDKRVFQPGDKVAFVNDAGIIYPGKTITGTEVVDGQERFFFAPHDAYWFSVPLKNLWKEPLTGYQKHLAFLQEEAPQLGASLRFSEPWSPSQEGEAGPEGLASHQAEMSRLQHLEWLFRLEYLSHMKKNGVDYVFTP